MFIAVTVIREWGENDIEKEVISFLNLDTVESIDLRDDKMTIFYKDRDSEGNHFTDILKNSSEEVSNKLIKASLLKL